MTNRTHLVDALRRVDGVADADIVDDEQGAGTLRLTLSPGADEVAVAMNVNGVLRDGFGLAVDAGKVQVVEETWSGRSIPASSAPVRAASPLRANEVSSVPPEGAHAEPDRGSRAFGVRADVPLTGGRRMAIRRLQLVSTSAGISTAVSLGLGTQTFVGEAEAGSSPESVQRGVAVATLRAVDAVLSGRAEVRVDHVNITPVGDDWVALVVAVMTTADGSDERLTGAAVVREDVRQAVIRATLDAVNRRVETVIAADDAATH